MPNKFREGDIAVYVSRSGRYDVGTRMRIIYVARNSVGTYDAVVVGRSSSGVVYDNELAPEGRENCPVMLRDIRHVL